MKQPKPISIVGHGAKIGQKMQPAIAALLSHTSVDAAAKSIGVHSNTLLRWMKEDKFVSSLNVARETMFSNSIGKLQDAADDAVSTILTIMHDKKAPVGLRLRAAEIVLQQRHPVGRPKDGSKPVSMGLK